MKLTRRNDRYEVKFREDMVLSCKEVVILEKMSYGKKVLLKKPVKFLIKEVETSFPRDIQLFIEEL